MLPVVVADGARDCAMSPHRPAGPNIQNHNGIEIQRIAMLPMNAVIAGEVFSGWSDGDPATLINVSHGGAETAGLLHSELPGLSAVGRSGGKDRKSVV